MIPPSNTPQDRQRRIDFDVLAPLTIVALLVAIVAAGMAFAANQDDGTSAAKAAAPAATEAAATEEAAPELKADFEMKPFDPKTAPVKPGPKTFELVTTEKNIKVGDKTYRMWTFNNSVPGPVMRAVVGDEITIKIRNADDSKLFHSVDYHASRLTMGGGHVQVKPGEEGTFTFKAEYPGVFMYHCATPPVVHHIGMGMYGMLIVQPKEGFGEEMPEYAITQSELYESEQDIEEGNEAAFAFNGIPSQYANNPIKLKKNAKVRLFVLNAGPNETSSFHVVGTVFDKVLDDGNPANKTVGRQALNIPASGGGVFEMVLNDEGQYPFVDHRFKNAAKGAVGMMIAGDGKPGPGGLDGAHAKH